uniref:Uncharacterized protein n=1 Tax=Paramoeba aestuarina TaxID=180227 RepID=A0A7S4PMA7_9EUKA|mmetsp:Transcript_8986/g.13605  ORF Transcript_8986/g.13605 Transcript_8986/m.13605 type:complete len:250 (+) Transcript_8986:1-750(+)
MCLHSAEEEGQWASALCLLRSLQKNKLDVTMLMYEEVIRATLCNSILSPNHVDCAWRIALDLMHEMKTVFGSTPSPYLQELMLAALIRRRGTTAESSYKIFREAEKTYGIKTNSRVVINAMLEKAFYEKSWGLFFSMKRRLYNCFPKRNTCEANLIIGATALTGHWWGAIAIWLRYKQAGMPYLCPTNKTLLLSCAERIHDSALQGAIQQELEGPINSENPLRRINFERLAPEVANIDALLQQVLATSK